MRVNFGFSWALIVLCLGVWLLCAVSPLERGTWLLEQVATVAALVTLCWMSRHVVPSRGAQLAIAFFFCVHTVGTHYTYSLTPYNEWSEAVLGTSLNEWLGWERNHYDRFVHFAYGFCLFLPCRELLQTLYRLSDRTVATLSVHLVFSTSAIYELLEWGAAAVFDDGSTAFLGTQGDLWDAQIDMALAGVGALLMAALCSLRGARPRPLVTAAEHD